MKIIRKSALGALVVTSSFLGACMDKKIIEDKTPFSANIVRLGDTVVAEVDGTSIYLSDIEHTALAKGLIKPGALLTPSDPLYQRILDELIDQRLLALAALQRSLDQNDETRRRLAAARERILSDTVVEALLAEKVTDEAARRIYEEQGDLGASGLQVRARQIVTLSEDEALEFKKLVENGGDFAALAKEFSIDRSTADLGGDLGYFSKGAVPDFIAIAAFKTKKGDVSAPFKSKLGWHILYVVDTRQTPRPKFEDVKPKIISYMTTDEIDKLLKSLRNDSTIVLKTGMAARPVLQPEKTPEETQPDAP